MFPIRRGIVVVVVVVVVLLVQSEGAVILLWMFGERTKDDNDEGVIKAFRPGRQTNASPQRE
jgi:hypothetical protein